MLNAIYSSDMISNGVSKTLQDGDASCQDNANVICFKNAWKSHDNINYALKNLSLNVPRSTIYSILGSSGSGKTSILSCIVGNCSLNSGSVQVNVNSKRHIGYMPQELALYEDLTIMETFRFFGILYNMTKEEVETSYVKLIQLLEIPASNRLIKNLSGGQKRRVSLSVSMLNDPELLVLDEPTVGLDSLLRDKIWKHLFFITRNERKTVVITTHYIEEAKNSDVVCFLKEGKPLLQGPPVKLVADFKTNSLEEIYFIIHWQEQQQEAKKILQNDPPDFKTVVNTYKEKYDFSFRRVVAFTSKSLMQIKRNPLMFYICLLLPGLLFILLREASRPPSSIKLGYINQETQCDNITLPSPCHEQLSCRHLQKIKDGTFEILMYKNLADGLEAVRKNKVWALLYYRSNFTQSVMDRLEFFSYEDIAGYHRIVDQATVWIDMSSYVISEMVKRGLYDSYLEAIHDWYQDCGWNSRYVQPVLKLEGWIHGKEDKSESSNSAAIPGAVILILYTISMSVGLIFILTEKESGTFLRCKVLGLSTAEMLLSELISSECLLVPPSVLLVCLMYFYWGQSKGSPVWVFFLLFVQLNAGIINGLLIALLTKNLTLALLISTGVATVSSYITGVMWPVEGMHWTGQWLNKLLPVSISVKSMQAITSRGAGIQEPQVAQGFINSFLWIALFLLVIRIIVWKQKK